MSKINEFNQIQSRIKKLENNIRAQAKGEQREQPVEQPAVEINADVDTNSPEDGLTMITQPDEPAIIEGEALPEMMEDNESKPISVVASSRITNKSYAIIH